MGNQKADSPSENHPGRSGRLPIIGPLIPLSYVAAHDPPPKKGAIKVPIQLNKLYGKMSHGEFGIMTP